VVTDQELFVHFKAYSHRQGAFGARVMPSQELFQCSKVMHNVFQKRIRDLLPKLKITHILQSEILQKMSFSAIDFCSNHRENVPQRIVAVFVRCRLYYYLKFETSNLFKKAVKPARKYRCVLQK